MTDTTDSEELLPNIEEAGQELKDVIKVETNQISQSNVDEEGSEELKGVIKVDPDHSLLLAEDILDIAEVDENLNPGSDEQELSTIELVRVDGQDNGEDDTERKPTASLPILSQKYCRANITSTFPESPPAERFPETGQNQGKSHQVKASQENANRNKFFRHLGFPNKRGRPKKYSENTELSKNAESRISRLRTEKVRMERQRRKGLADLFDNLQASVHQHSNLPNRSRSSYLTRTLDATDCIEELERKV